MTGLSQRKLEWEAERRFLNNERRLIDRRIAELDEILREFWPERRVANG